MKHLSLKRIREVFPNFNETPVTEAQFWKACKRFKIIVKSIPLICDGYHERKRGRYFIILNSRLTGKKWLHTAFHEFCHFLFDAPDEGDYVFFRSENGCGELTDGNPSERKRRRKQRERFADTVGLACLIPLPEVKQLSVADHSDDPDIQMYAQRIEALSVFGF